jgi:hypothetical protein
MHLRVSIAILVAGLLVGQRAAAAKPRAAAREQARERQAKKACLSGDYVNGIAILAGLFVETEDPTFLYNQGRCYEQNVRYVEAAERFREYLRKAENLSAGDRAEAEKHIADCEAAAAKTQPRAVADAPPAPAPAPSPADAAPSPAEVTSPAPPAATPPMEHPWQHTAKWIATGAAVAFLGLGVVEHVRYYGKNKDYNDDPSCGVAGQCKDLADSADTARLVAIVGYGAAAVAAGLAITFWLTDSPRVQSAPQASISVACSPTWAGAMCGGRF